MSDLHRAVEAELQARRPEWTPPFEALQARKRRRDQRRAGSAVAASAVAVFALGFGPSTLGLSGGGNGSLGGSPTQQPVASPRNCTNADLALTASWRLSNPGLTGSLVAVNKSGSPCNIAGTPTFDVLDEHDADLKAPLIGNGPLRRYRLVLAPGEQARAGIAWGNWCGSTKASGKLRVHIGPGSTRGSLVTASGPTQPACTHTGVPETLSAGYFTDTAPDAGHTPAQGTEACPAPIGDRVYLLGGEGNGQPLAGNNAPVEASVGVGERFTVRAHFAERGVSVPSTPSAAVRLLCQHTRRKPGGGNETMATFIGVRPGSADIRSSTNDCGPCANLAFTAHVTVLTAYRPD